MTIPETLREIFACPSVQRYQPGSSQSVSAALTAAGLVLPKAHEVFLATSNGLMGYGGYFRLFGVTTSGGALGCNDIAHWNELGTWKFAWPKRVQEHLCFGETAWGDQYGYRYDELRTGSSSAIYFLESFVMRPEKIADSFDVFLAKEFLRNCMKPYDDTLIEARGRIGDLAVREHITYVPSPLITGVESLGPVVKMNATATMIANGDLASQLGDELQSRPIAGIEPYTDAQGRPRLKVVWADQATK